MANKLTIGGPKETAKPLGEKLERKQGAPSKPAGVVPSKPLFSKLSAKAKQSLAGGQRDERTLGTSTAGGGFLRLQTEKGANDLAMKAQASRALFNQNTVPKSDSNYAADRQKLDAFFEQAKSVSPTELSKLVAARPDLLDASIDFLAHRFTPIGFDQVGGDPDAKNPTAVALRLVQEMDDDRKARFLESVVFNVAHPANHQALWPAIVNSVPADQLEKALLEKSNSSNELHALNALTLPFHVYGRKPGYDLSDSARSQLTEQAAARGADPTTNNLVRQSLQDFALPVNL